MRQCAKMCENIQHPSVTCGVVRCPLAMCDIPLYTHTTSCVTGTLTSTCWMPLPLSPIQHTQLPTETPTHTLVPHFPMQLSKRWPPPGPSSEGLHHARTLLAPPIERGVDPRSGSTKPDPRVDPLPQTGFHSCRTKDRGGVGGVDLFRVR